MARVSKFIKNSDYDASFQRQAVSARINLPNSPVYSHQSFKASISVPPGAYISDVIAKTDRATAWDSGTTSILHDGGDAVGSVSLYGYVYRASPSTYEAEVHVLVFGGGTSAGAPPASYVDFKCVLSELPV